MPTRQTRALEFRWAPGGSDLNDTCVGIPARQPPRAREDADAPAKQELRPATRKRTGLPARKQQ